MSLTEHNKLEAVVMALQRTVQLLVDRADGQPLGRELVEPLGVQVGCDEAEVLAEQIDEKGKEVEVVDPGLVDDSSGKRKAGDQKGAADDSRTRKEGVAMTFGGFDGVVPVEKDERLRVLEISSDSGSGSSLLIESDRGCWADDAIEMSEKSLGRDDDTLSFHKEYVRNSEVRRMQKFLASRGVIVRKDLLGELALSRYTAGTVPDAFRNGRAKLKSLALVGDKIMAAVVVDVMYSKGKAASEIQGFLSRSFTRIALSPICVNSGLGAFVVVPSGVDLGKTAVGGEALEAVAGVVYHSSGIGGVTAFLKAMQLL